MKQIVKKWPVTLTLEVADDYKEGIESFQDDVDKIDELQELVDYIADGLIKAKGLILAQQEANSKSNQ